MSAPADLNVLRLHRPDGVGVKFEKPWHRSAAHMLAAGLSPTEVAEAVEHTPSAIYSLLKTPWFQETVTQLIRDHGGRDIQQLFAAEQFNCFVTLCEVRDNPKASANVRASVANSMLDRSMGKATQKVELTQGVRSDDPVAEAERLERENRMLSGI